MKPQEKGWLKEYLEFRKSLLMDLTTDKARKSSHPEHSLYSVVQPTGLMYGHTVGSINHPDEATWNEQSKMQILLAESLISSSLLFHEKTITNPKELSDIIVKTLENIGNFYNNIFPEIATPSRSFLERRNLLSTLPK
ncbi:MAG: hypothetical protein HC859_02240 [Bacteroidia bacterium]|nr:hypothetical protein [Bacteroidia bacterium]